MISWINCGLSIANLILILIDLRKTIKNQEILEDIRNIREKEYEAYSKD